MNDADAKKHKAEVVLTACLTFATGLFIGFIVSLLLS